jgi:hypothetical protein
MYPLYSFKQVRHMTKPIGSLLPWTLRGLYAGMGETDAAAGAAPYVVAP